MCWSGDTTKDLRHWCRSFEESLLNEVEDGVSNLQKCSGRCMVVMLEKRSSSLDIPGSSRAGEQIILSSFLAELFNIGESNCDGCNRYCTTLKKELGHRVVCPLSTANLVKCPAGQRLSAELLSMVVGTCQKVAWGSGISFGCCSFLGGSGNDLS